MIAIKEYIDKFPAGFHFENEDPWEITAGMAPAIEKLIAALNDDFVISNNVAIHKTAIIETGVILKAPVIISANCFVGAHAYLRGGVFLDERVSIGPGCEIKSSIICNNSAAAHFNFIGDSIIGSNVNFEAGSIIANHYNEREDKQISVRYKNDVTKISSTKFGALVGDGCRIGANAVLSPGTLLDKKAIVHRLELVKQVT